MKRRPPRSTQSRSSAASDVYKRQARIGAADKGDLGQGGWWENLRRRRTRDEIAFRGKKLARAFGVATFLRVGLVFFAHSPGAVFFSTWASAFGALNRLRAAGSFRLLNR